MVIVLALSWAILRIPSVPIARSADRVTMIVGAHSVYGFVLSSITITRNDSPYWWLVALTLTGGCLTGLAATFLLRGQPGEYALPPAPSKEEVTAAFRDADLAYQEFCSGADEYLRRLKQQ
jgi:hypothetical protein